MPLTSATGSTSDAFLDFPSRAYLQKYYRSVGAENAALLRAIHESVDVLGGSTDSIIEVAGGPCLYSMMGVAAHRRRPFKRITFTDIGWQNLSEVAWWLRDDPHQFDYSELLSWLEAEFGASSAEVTDALRASPWELVQRDWLELEPAPSEGRYDVVSSHFFAESATRNEDEFVELLSRIARLGRPGATVLMSFMCRSEGYTVAGVEFPAFAVDESSLMSYLEAAGVGLESPLLRIAPTEDPSSQPGYDGMVFVGGRLIAAEEQIREARAA